MLFRYAILIIVLGVGSVLSVTDVRASEQVYYFHNDHLGTPQAMSDASGRKVWEAEYEPFGKATVNQDPDGDGQIVINNLRFPGQYYDTETGLHYNYHRDYDPATGRYLEADPLGVLGLIQLRFTGRQPNVDFSGLDISLYSYVMNDPINFTDPLGLWRIGGTIGMHTFEWNSERPYNVNIQVSTNLSVGGGVGFDFKNPFTDNAPKLPVNLDVGLGRWLGISTDNETMTVKVGLSLGLSPVSLTYEQSCPVK